MSIFLNIYTTMNVVFSGGGIKGLAYIGVVQYFEENSIQIKNISGTSIGSLISVMLNLGYSSFEMKNIAFNLDINMLENINISLLLKEYGLDDGKKIEYFIKYLFKTKGYKKSITFKQLYEATGLHLFITCCNIEDYSQKIFDYLRTPEEKVWFACKCSMSIPLIWTLNEQKYIDGCFSRNIPMEVFPIENTIGFYLTKDRGNKEINNIKDYIMNLMACSFYKGNSLEIEKYKTIGYKVVEIKVNCSPLDMNLSTVEKSEIIQGGYDSCSPI
jgi:NTE family protein